MKEMIGGCCVCSDEEGSSNNPIVYCDGADCFVAVHKGCYGIDTIPDGAWFCRKCESADRSARVRCELCPIKEGALKRTVNGGWCHVLCALFIPEVDFVNMYTMEPITLERLAPERLGKVCFICHNDKQFDLSTRGACITCNESSCKIAFHASCAHIRGLLIEERGARSKLITYVGYCLRHFKKAILPDNQKLRNIIARPLPAFQHPALTRTPEPSTSTSSMQVPPIKLNLSQISNSATSKRYSNPTNHSLNSSVCNTTSEMESINISVKSEVDNTEANGDHYVSQPPSASDCQQKNANMKKGGKPLTSSKQNRRNFTKKVTAGPSVQHLNSTAPPIKRKETHLPQSWKQYDHAAPFKEEFPTDALYFNNTEPTLHPPTRLNTVSDLDLVLPQSSDNASRKKMKSMEELLDWQWDQGALLLMQQSQSSDIVTLLNSLHELRKENDGLECKALKLLRKRDHLLYVNAQLKQILNATPLSSNGSTDNGAEQNDTKPTSSEVVEEKSSVLTALPSIKIYTSNNTSS